MNVRLSILLVLVLLLIGGSVGITYSLRSKEPTKQPPWLYKINVDNIANISVTHGDAQTEYARITEGQWVIKDGNDTPVDTAAWSGATQTLSGPRSSRVLAEQIDEPAKYGLESPRTRVRLLDKSGYPLMFYLGDATPDGKNWYAKVETSSRLFTVTSLWGREVAKIATDPPYPKEAEGEAAEQPQAAAE